MTRHVTSRAGDAATASWAGSPDALSVDAASVLASWHAPDPAAERLRGEYLDFLSAHPDGVYRSCVPEHLTASVLLLDATGRNALLTLHRKGGFWAQLGGHCETGDATLAAAALREAREESGIDAIRLLDGPVDLDRHELSGAFGSCRVHWDVRYAAVAVDGAIERISDESSDLRWFPLEELEHPGAVVDLQRLARAAVRAWRMDQSTSGSPVS